MGDSKRLHRILKLIKYANLCAFLKNHKNCFFLISYPILIPFALYDSTRWGIRNFYTEFWNSLNMLIYVHFSKITKIASSSFIDRFQIFFFHLKDFHEVHWTSTRNFEILSRKLFMLIYAKFIKKITKMASSSFIDWFWFFLFHLKDFQRFSELHGILKFCLVNNLC